MVLLSLRAKVTGWLCKYSSTNNNHFDQVRNWFHVGRWGWWEWYMNWRAISRASADPQGPCPTLLVFKELGYLPCLTMEYGKEGYGFFCLPVTLQIFRSLFLAWIFIAIEFAKAVLRMSCSRRWRPCSLKSSFEKPISSVSLLLEFQDIWAHRLALTTYSVL